MQVDKLIALEVVEALYGAKSSRVQQYRIDPDGSRHAWVTDIARDLKIRPAELERDLVSLRLKQLAK